MDNRPIQEEDPPLSSLADSLGMSRPMALAAGLAALALLAAAVFWFVHLAPPRTLTISTGPEGSTSRRNAEAYRTFLKKEGITLEILPSQGSLENLARLNDPNSGVDLGFIQGGVTNDPASNKLVTLGSMNYAPMLVFYRGEAPVEFLSAFAGKRLAVGAEGSGTRELALRLLALNGITTNDGTRFESPDGEEAAKGLLRGDMDAIFIMSDSASGQVMSNLLHAPGIRLYDFTQADAYTRRITFVNKLILPQGALDFAKNLPPRDVNLIGPMVEVIAKPTLHPALSDLVIEAMQATNGSPGLYRKRGEFPALILHDFPISPDAERFYKTGKTYLYRVLPFWLASLVSRFVVVILPMLVVVIPCLRLIPAFFRWRLQRRLTRWYRELLNLERSVLPGCEPARRQESLAELADIETAVNKMKVPATFADQFYVLRGHITYVHQQLRESAGGSSPK